MIAPCDFKLDDFTDGLPPHLKKSLQIEDLHGSVLIDNLILLRIADLSEIQIILKERYQCRFTWLNIDPTPPELAEFSAKYGVLFQREQGFMVVYIPLGQDLDDAELQIDIPNYKLAYVFISDCNYRIIKMGISTPDISRLELTADLADFRPLLILRRIVYDCSQQAGTDIHFESAFKNGPTHDIYYKIQGDKVPSSFKLDKDLTYKVLLTAISKLSSASAADLNSNMGITTNIPDIYQDDGVDLRLTAMTVSAGLYCDIAVQTTRTTTMTVDELGFPKADVSAIREIAKRRTGLTLITGAVRTGKNTTVLAIANELQKLPIQIVEYSNPVEVRMGYAQKDYHGDINILQNCLRLAKKQDIDIAILNEIPDAGVAFAVRDLVNSSIGVITTMHINRVWHAPNKLHEFFGKDYKTIISQLNAVVNQKLFKVWQAPGLQKRILQPTQGDLEKFAYKWGVRQYFVPTDISKVTYRIQPLAEIIILTDEERTAMLNFDELSRSEQMLKSHVEKAKGTLECKLADFINQGLCSLDQMEKLKTE